MYGIVFTNIWVKNGQITWRKVAKSKYAQSHGEHFEYLDRELCFFFVYLPKGIFDLDTLLLS